MHNFVTILALPTEQGVRKSAICLCPPHAMTGSASKAEKGPNFIRLKFSKKGARIFFKYVSGNTKTLAFEWHASLVLSPQTPSNDLCYLTPVDLVVGCVTPRAVV